MQVFSVIRGFGPGGLTSAVLNRASLLRRAGYASAVIAMSFIPDIDEACARLVEHGRADPDVPVLNPFRDLAEAFGDRAGYTPALKAYPHLTFTRAKSRTDGLTRSFGLADSGERVLRVLRRADDAAVVRVDVLDAAGSLLRREHHAGSFAARVVDYAGGTRVGERFLSRGGFCYLHRVIEPDSQQVTSAELWLPGDDTPSRHPDDAGWERAYLTSVAGRSAGTTVLLIDEDGIPYDYLAMDAPRTKVVPVVHASHESPDVPSPDANGLPFARLGEFPAVVFLTQSQAHDVTGIAGAVPSARVIPNYVPAVDHPVSGTGGLPSNHDVVLVSRLVPTKRVDDAIRAFAAVVVRVPDARLRIYGYGSEQDNLEQLAGELGIAEHVEFCGYTTDAPQAIADARVSIMTSEHEGFGLVIVESLAVGTPVVALDCKYGPRDLILDDVTGYVVPDRDLDVFARRIGDVLTDDALRQRLSTSGREWAAEHLRARHIALQWEDLLASLA